MEVVLLAFSLALIPIYSFASGGVQFSHGVLALFMLIRLVRHSSVPTAAELSLLALLALILLREAYSIFVEGVSPLALLEVLYIAFATIVVFTFSRIDFGDHRFTRALNWGIVLSVAVALAGIWLYGASLRVDDGAIVRSVGTFNNPNQLAYFAICIFSISSLLYIRDVISVPFYVGMLASAILLAITALSKAGLLAVGFGTLIAASALLNRKKLSPALIVLATFITAIVVQVYAMGLLDGFSFVRRLEGIGTDSDDNLAFRGYLLPGGGNPLEFLFGIGQSGAIRLVGHEVHSTFWSFLLKYGLVGFSLFMLFFWQWAKQVFRESGILGLFLVVAPAALYGITHNGSRFAIFWILIGLTFSRSVATAAAPRPQGRPVAPFPYQPPLDWQPRQRGGAG